VRLAQALLPDWLLLSGDITQRATTARFTAARVFVQRLQVSHLLALPGNHDIPLWHLPLRLLRLYARYSVAFGSTLEPGFENEALLHLTVNTLCWWRHQEEQISPSQVQCVAERLRNARPAQRRVVMVHQPVAAAPAVKEPDRLHRHALAVQQWGGAGVDPVVGGDIHCPYVLPLPAHCWAVQAGTAVSRRVRLGASNSVNLIRIGAQAEERATVERCDHDAAQDAFAPVALHRLRRG